MSRHQLLQTKTLQYCLKAPKTTKNTTLNYDNISIFQVNNNWPQQEDSNEIDEIETQNWQHDNQEFGYDDNNNRNFKYYNREPNNDKLNETSWNNMEYDNEIQKINLAYLTTLQLWRCLPKTAYYNLIQILLHSQFDKTYLITNLPTLKKYCEKLPLMQIRSHKVPINTRNTPSTTKNFTK
ncbi:12350_t:CDS:2, partial [Dentiscutata erythropus]